MIIFYCKVCGAQVLREYFMKHIEKEHFDNYRVIQALEKLFFTRDAEKQTNIDIDCGFSI